MARTESKILSVKPKRAPRWELVDKDGNRLDDVVLEAKNAETAALEFFRRAGNDVRKEKDGT